MNIEIFKAFCGIVLAVVILLAWKEVRNQLQ
jgi:hypothetical protein